MASSLENGVKEEPKTQFSTREGTYRLMAHSDYSRPNRVGCTNAGHANTPVQVSFATVKDQSGTSERICFNHGRELYLYAYRGIRKAADLTKPIDKRVYKSTSPTCHDLRAGPDSSSDGLALLVGFTGGQMQLIHPVRKDANKIFNDEQVIEKTRVTCVRWLPNTPHQFLASHASGHLYLYSERLSCGPAAPTYQTFKQGDGFTVYTCKARSTRNPLYRWAVGEGAVNRFAFSPCGAHLATASQDGCLRVFRYDSMELAGVARSYFGALTCVAWSPDGRYVAAGGEDDLLTVWSLAERRVVARGRGHRSWVADVAFDPYTSVLDAAGDAGRPAANGNGHACDASAPPPASYRIGSVGQDTQLCLWDLTDDLLRRLGRPPRQEPADRHARLPAAGRLPHPGAARQLSRQSRAADVAHLPARLSGDRLQRRLHLHLGAARQGGQLSSHQPGSVAEWTEWYQRQRHGGIVDGAGRQSQL